MQNVIELAKFQKIVSSAAAVVVHFWAPWCEPCTLLDEVLKQLCADSPSVSGVRVEAEEAADIAEKYNVAAVPLFLFFHNGVEIDRLEGADPAGLTTKFQSLAGKTTSGAPQPTAAANGQGISQSNGSGALKTRLEALLKQQHVMLFMKGTPEAPRCGFSRKTAEALTNAGIKFGHFDILEDEAVRQGLKEYSNWPTYPQVYANGELVGGCDIILELAEAGELKNELAPESAAADEANEPAINDRLKALISSSQVMLFMKGTPEAPRCGFSRKTAEALTNAGIKFRHFDILEDEAVRQGLKEYSNWPTYPQVYANGELVGGCDIILELASTGELSDLVAN